MTTNANFTIDGDPSSNGGYDAAAGDVLPLQLEDAITRNVLSCTYSVFETSTGAPSASIASSGIASPPDAAVNLTIPSGSGLFATYGIRATVQTPSGPVVAERIVAVKKNGLRKPIPFELTQYDADSFYEAVTAAIDALGSSEQWTVVNIDNANSPYTASFGELVRCDATSGPITVNLPAIAAAHDGKVVAVQKTDASGNAITMDGNSSQTINGSATATLTTQWERAGLVADNTSGDWSK